MREVLSYGVGTPIAFAIRLARVCVDHPFPVLEEARRPTPALGIPDPYPGPGAKARAA